MLSQGKLRKMLFAVWTENRATEDGDRNSLHSQNSGRNNTIFRSNSLNMPSPPVQLTTVTGDDHATIKAITQLDANEEQIEQGYEDRRPAVFRSTFWEVMCVASLVCGQLTNVLHLPVVLTAGTGSCSTNHHSCLDSVLSFNDRSAGVGKCRARNSRWLVSSVVREIGRHIRTEEDTPDFSDVACRRRGDMWT